MQLSRMDSHASCQHHGSCLNSLAQGPILTATGIRQVQLQLVKAEINSTSTHRNSALLLPKPDIGPVGFSTRSIVSITPTTQPAGATIRRKAKRPDGKISERIGVAWRAGDGFRLHCMAAWLGFGRSESIIARLPLAAHRTVRRPTRLVSDILQKNRKTSKSGNKGSDAA